MTTGPRLPDTNLSLFFPAKQHDGNAASAYTRAFEYYNADSDRTRFVNQWDVLIKRPLMRRALEYVTSGTRCRSCDFIPYLPDDLSRSTKFPYLYETQVLARLMATRIGHRLAAKDRKGALDAARSLMAFGRHLRQSALVLDQEIQGIAIQSLAVGEFEKIFGPEADAVTSAKLGAMRWVLDASRNYIADQITSHSVAGAGFSADLAWLRSPYPVFRCQAIINIAQATFPPRVLLKPTPPISIQSVMRQLALTTTETIPLRNEAFSHQPRIKWPRKGVRPSVTREDVGTLRKLLEPVATSDPSPRVRTLARRFLDSLAEPPPRPAVRAADRRTSPRLRRIPPPPRPPRVPRPPGFRVPPPRRR